jgi:hypothetical protein
MCDICGADPCVSSGFCSESRKADREIGQRRLPPGIPPDWDKMSLGALWVQLSQARRTPQTTIEAIMYSVRGRGIAALKEPANVERLRRCDAAALAQIDARISKLSKGNER